MYINNKLLDGIEVYLLNELEDIAIRVPPKGDEYYAKHKGGGKEYLIGGKTNVVTTAFISFIELTKEEYLNY